MPPEQAGMVLGKTLGAGSPITQWEEVKPPYLKLAFVLTGSPKPTLTKLETHVVLKRVMNLSN